MTRVGGIGPENPNWKGGRRVDSRGYVLLWIDGKDVPEHRYVMEQHLGRKLLRNENVHHRNHVKDDNRVENLEVKLVNEHIRDHWAEGHYAPRVARQTAPDAECVDCGEVKHIQGRGLCSRCYLRHYTRAQRARRGDKVRKTTTYFD